MEPQSQLLDRILERKAAFAGVFLLVFAVSYGVLYALDFYPEPPAEPNGATEEAGDSEREEREPSRLRLEANLENAAPDSTRTPNTSSEDAEASTADIAALPTSIAIPSLDREVTVLNPQSRSIADLDAALLEGAVRHPDSATFTNEGTIFILGHSSYLPNVINRNYQAFNGIQHLNWGDTIELTSDDKTYTYRVEKVYQAKASEVTVPIADTGPRLVIATCDSFASKDDRYIVEAKLISSSLL